MAAKNALDFERAGVAMYKVDNKWESMVYFRELYSWLCGDQNGKEILKRMDICMCVCAQSGPTLCTTMDYSIPGSSVHGILQARILEWAAISSS